MPLKEFAGNAPATRLSGSLASGVTTTFSVITGGGTGYPTGATASFVVVIDRGTSLEEKILCSSRSGDVFTIAASGRGYDDTTAQNHAAQAIVEHCLDAGTVEEANLHVNDDARDDHSQYLNAARHDLEARHAFGSALGAPGAPVDVTGKNAAATGSGDDAAREDHRHGLVLPRFHITRATNQSIPNSTLEAVVWTAETTDTDDFWSSGSEVDLPWTGLYIITVQVAWASDSSGYRNVTLTLNGGTRASDIRDATSSEVRQCVTFPLEAAAGDNLAVFVSQTSGGALNLLGSGTLSWLKGVYLGA